MDSLELWRRYKHYLSEVSSLGLSVDISRMNFDDELFTRLEPQLAKAFTDMADLEAGDIANPDENRQVGHYWLRTPHLSPNDEIRQQIEQATQDVLDFAEQIHSRAITPPDGSRFSDLVVIGIGGSALGPQFLADALGSKRDRLAIQFMDNTDPDGYDRVIAELGVRLKSTLIIVISKSGGTKETRNAMLEMRQVFTEKGLDFSKHAVAVTSEGSELDQLAQSEGWLKRFPMWDWIGGRTSVTSAVGLLPAALQGIDVLRVLEGAAEMDAVTRKADIKKNPAARLAASWYHATNGRGEKDMVILPYKDRLLMLSRYLQQLVMESLGKELDLAGNVVNQGLTVYGNKGSTDQHAYVQQLRDGVANFFATFVVVQQDRSPNAAKKAENVEPGVTSGDYLLGFWQGTRQALHDKGRESITISIEKLDPRSVGGLIALFERAVGIYASLINVNAYHQPGVEAGKKAAAEVLVKQAAVVAWMKKNPEPATVEQIADRMGIPYEVETLFHVLEHLALNKRYVARARGRFKWIG